MGNKCSCLQGQKDHQTCDLSNGTNNNTVFPQNIPKLYHNHNNKTEGNNDPLFPVTYTINENNDKFRMCSQTNTSIIQPPQQPLNIPPHLATKMNKHIKGYLFRKRFNSSLKQQLKEWEDQLYNHFTTKIAFNPKVNRVLYESPMNQYLCENYSQYYNINPNSVVQSQINKIKKYKNGFIIKYTSTPSSSIKLSLNSINTFLSNDSNV